VLREVWIVRFFTLQHRGSDLRALEGLMHTLAHVNGCVRMRCHVFTVGEQCQCECQPSERQCGHARDKMRCCGGFVVMMLVRSVKVSGKVC